MKNKIIDWWKRHRVTVAFLAVVIVSFLVLTFISVLVYRNHEQGLRNKRQDARNREFAQQGKEAHDAICVLRIDLRSRVAEAKSRLHDSEKFLEDHPNGISGISRKLLLKTIADQKISIINMNRTIAALNKVKNCNGIDSTSLAVYNSFLIVG